MQTVCNAAPQNIRPKPAMDPLQQDFLLILLLCFCSALIIALSVTPVIIKIARVKNLLVEPCERSAHLHKTPNLGGIAIFCAILCASCLWANFTEINGIQYYIFALAVLFFIGVKDDLLQVSPQQKFAAQMIASLAVVALGDVRITSLQGFFGIYELYYWPSVGFTLVTFAFIINAYNLIDGIDGLAGGLGIISAGFFAIFFAGTGHFAYATIAISLVGALAGFLRFNFSSKRKIFMGDTGSMLVGFFMSIFVVKFLYLENFEAVFGFNNSPVVAVSILVIPLFDTIRVFIIRLLNGMSPFYPDRNHIHHLLLNSNLNHPQASVVLYLVNILVVAISIVFFHDVDITVMFLLFAGVLMASSMFYNNPHGKTRRSAG